MKKIKPLFKDPNTGDLLRAVTETTNWIESNEITTDYGKTWRYQLPADETDLKSLDDMDDLSFYSGLTGIVFYYINLYKATKNTKYLALAEEGANHIIHQWNPDDGKHEAFGLENSQWAFYAGGAGIGFVINELWKINNKEEYFNFFKGMTDSICNAAKTDETGYYWSGEIGVFTDAGTVLYLLYANSENKSEKWLDTAKKAGERMLSQGYTIEGQAGLVFNAFHGHIKDFDDDAYYPNFEMGSAGAAYTLARLYQETNDEKFLKGATEAAKHLMAIATVDDDGKAALIGYRIPDMQDLYYLGYCHGPIGTSRLFSLLYRITNDAVYDEWVEKLYEGLVRAGAPEKHSDGYWHIFSECCGTAGMLNGALGIWLENKNDKYLDLAKRCANVIISEVYQQEDGARWFQSFERTDPWSATADTGFSTGASGIGTSLLNLYLILTNQFDIIRTPDNPYKTK